MDRERILAELGKLGIALQFFTRLPLPASLAQLTKHEAGLASAAAHFPVAGLIVGLVCAAILLVAGALLPQAVAAGLALAFGIWLTGGLHEDGLADCADGFGGANTGERALEIMRDSRIGVFGACALAFSIGLRWTALSALSLSGAALALVVAHGAARGAVTLALASSKYARKDGVGALVAAGISWNEFALAAGVSAAVGLLFAGFAGVGAVIAGFGAAGLFLAYSQTRIGGYTGDVLGAMEQIAEIAVLCALVAFWQS